VTPEEPPIDPPGSSVAAAPPKHCPGPTKRGVSCIYVLKTGESHCWNHDPRRAADRKAAGAVRRQPGDPGTELATYDGIARRAAKVLELLEDGVVVVKKGDVVWTAKIEAATANARINTLRFLASLVQLRAERKKGGEDGDAGADLKELFG
jgi:hypothetical protein